MATKQEYMLEFALRVCDEGEARRAAQKKSKRRLKEEERRAKLDAELAPLTTEPEAENELQ
jgi:hypothetical protein